MSGLVRCRRCENAFFQTMSHPDSDITVDVCAGCGAPRSDVDVRALQTHAAAGLSIYKDPSEVVRVSYIYEKVCTEENT